MKQQMQTTQAPPMAVESQAVYDAAAVGTAIARHGDLMLAKSQLPRDAKLLTTMELLRSTVTGHVHGMVGAATVYSGTSQLETGSGHYVVVAGPASIGMHLEHKDIGLPVGTYEVLRKREFSEDFSRPVVD